MNGSRHLPKTFLRTVIDAVRRLGPALLLTIGLTNANLALAEADSLLRMASSGRITLGVRDTTVPLSYMDAGGAHVGYHLDVCQHVVGAIRRRFDMPALKVVVVPTTLATRFAMLNNHTVDMDCGHNTVNPAAMQQALLSHATLIVDVQIMTREDTAVRSVADLNGRTVGVVVGSTAVPALRVAARKAQLKVREVPSRHEAEAFQLLEQGRVDAIAFSTPYELAMRARAAEPRRFVLLDTVLRTDPVALMFNLEDERLHGLANEVLVGLMRSGEMGRLYSKWFEQPIPGQPQPLGMPLPPRLMRLFSQPGAELLEL